MRTLQEFETLHARPREFADELLERPRSAEEIQRTEAAGRRTGRLQAAVVGMLAMALALALPTARLVDPTVEWVEALARGAWIGPHLALFPLARVLVDVVGLAPESAWLALSALAWALCFPVLVDALFAVGADRRVALAGAVLAAAAPAAWLSATLVGPAAPGLLGAALLLRGVLVGTDLARPALGVRAAAWWLLAVLLNAGNALLLPAVVWAVAAHRPAGERERGSLVRGLLPLAAAPLLFAVLVLLTARLAGLEAQELTREVLDAAIGRARLRETKVLIWLVVVLPGLGVGLMGIIALFLPPEGPVAGRPPAWLAAWFAVPLLSILVLGRPSLGLALLPLLPGVAVGFAYWFQRLSTADLQGRFACFGLGQLAMTVAFCVMVANHDPDAGWRREVRPVLAASDLLLTRFPTHHFLARHRMGLESIDLNEPVELEDPTEARNWWKAVSRRVTSADKAGRRVVIDLGPRARRAALGTYPFPSELHRLQLLTETLDLDDLCAERSIDAAVERLDLEELEQAEGRELEDVYRRAVLATERSAEVQER